MLPKLLFVAEQKEDDGSVWFQAERLALNAIQDDGPTVVGTYQLVGTRTLKKTVSGASEATVGAGGAGMKRIRLLLRWLRNHYDWKGPGESWG